MSPFLELRQFLFLVPGLGSIGVWIGISLGIRRAFLFGAVNMLFWAAVQWLHGLYVPVGVNLALFVVCLWGHRRWSRLGVGR